MRLHSLEITGFGPFAGSERVDLDALASGGLFLIHGPTGAGKSSILDAICFALYAAVPGARSGARASLRSDHAAEGVVPEVTLDFTVGGRRMRVCRSPEFSRRKKRGTGETSVPAKVVLHELLGSDWQIRATRSDEAALLLKDVLGMGMEQFTKVVLLPQGDFAAFLRASPEERRGVLERLFDTKRFTDVESWLVERRRSTEAARGAAAARLSTGLLRVDDVMARLEPGDDIVTSACSDVPAEQVDTMLEALLDAVDLRAITDLTGVETATAVLVQAESAVNRGSIVTHRQQVAAQACDRLRLLNDQHEVYRETQRIVAAAERAQAVSGFLDADANAHRRSDAARAKVSVLRGPFAHLLSAETITEVDRDALATDELIQRVADHSAAFQQVAAVSSRAGALARESAKHSQAARRQERAATVLAQDLGAAQAGRAAAELTRDAGRAAAARLGGLEDRHSSLTRLQRLHVEQDRSASALEDLERDADCADRLLLGARGVLLDLRERRLAGMAAELSEGISPGDPCPVCGSCVHPNPAQTTDPVRPSDIRSAEADQTQASEALILARSRVAAELAGRQARAVQIATDKLSATAPEILDAVAVSGAAVEQARRTAASLPGAEAELTALTNEAERLRSLIEQMTATKASSLALAASARSHSEQAHAEVASLLAVHDESCPCQIRGAGHLGDHDPLFEPATISPVGQVADVAEVITRHGQTSVQLSALAQGLYELITQQASANDTQQRLSTALQEHGFKSRQEAQDALLAPGRVSELTALLRAHEQQRAQAEALLAQPEVFDAREQPVPDLGELAALHRRAAARLSEAGSRHTLSEQAKRDLRVLASTVHHALAELGPAEEEARLVQGLADCVTGNSVDNALRMRLSSYVLAARLCEISTLANERLGTMSDDRYSLEYTDARAAKGARSGLGLLVRDAWTGQTRQTSSLSGGEAFMASLALALGLGDAVRAEAGGFDLQTLFVDEGFGSLDEESLEQVMAVLDTLREGGRAVGIVSHVSELRTRIPHQLSVLKAQAGSRISTAQPDSPAA